MTSRNLPAIPADFLLVIRDADDNSITDIFAAKDIATLGCMATVACGEIAELGVDRGVSRGGYFSFGIVTRD